MSTKNDVGRTFSMQHSGYGGGSIGLEVGDFFTRDYANVVKVDPAQTESILPGENIRLGGLYMQSRPVPHNGLYQVQAIFPHNDEYGLSKMADGKWGKTPPGCVMEYICLR